MYSVLLLLLLLPPFWLRTIFSLFSQLSANANRTRIPFFAFSFVSLVVHARSNSNLRYEMKKQKKNKNVIQWDFFAFLLATEKKKMNEKTSFFFTDSAHTCLCNDVSNSNTMERYFFFFLVCVRIFHQHISDTTTSTQLHSSSSSSKTNKIDERQLIRIAVVLNGIRSGEQRQAQPTSCQTRPNRTQTACHFIYSVFIHVEESAFVNCRFVLRDLIRNKRKKWNSPATIGWPLSIAPV